jgi:hypothetical protein
MFEGGQIMKITRSPIDSQPVSNAPQAAPKEEVKKAPVSAEIQSRWDTFTSEQATQGGAMDPNALVQEVLHESYVQTTEDLRFYAEKVKYFNETKKEIRDHMSKLRDYESNLKGNVDSLKPGKAIDPNVMETLANAIRESAKDSQEDKKSALRKLADLNKIATAISQYQNTISDTSQRLAAKEKKDDDD